MDIRSIIDPEPSTSTSKRPVPAPKPQERQPPQNFSQSFQSPYGPPPPGHHLARENRPPQPPPLQAPVQNDFRSSSTSSYQSVQSPYQPTPFSTHGGSQYPFPRNSNQSPSHGGPGFQYQQRDGQTAQMGGGYPPYGQSTPMSQTPTAATPDSAQTYFSQNRPQSSHSAFTPMSAQAQTSNFARQSPSITQQQTRAPSQKFVSQQYLSQPSTPLGPPATFGKANSGMPRDSPGSYVHKRNHSGGSYSHPAFPALSPHSEHPGSFHVSPLGYGARGPRKSSRDQSTSVERERSLSVSPKTRLPSQPRIDISRGVQDTPSSRQHLFPDETVATAHDGWESQNMSEPWLSQKSSRSFALGVNGILNNPSMTENSELNNQPVWNSQQTASQTIASNMEQYPSVEVSAQQRPDKSRASTASNVVPSVKQAVNLSQTTPSQGYQSSSGPPSLISIQSQLPLEPSFTPSQNSQQLSPQTTPQPKVDLAAMSPHKAETEQLQPPVNSTNLPVPSGSRKRRREDPPIWAQSSRGLRKSNPFLARNKPSPGTVPPLSKGVLSMEKPGIIFNRKQSPPIAEANGHTVAANGVRLPPSQNGPLGAWEPTILNEIPSEEVTRIISDFLYTEVVMRDGVGVAPAGGGKLEGAVLEIEAKVGQIIDKNSDERLRLPVMTECVLDKSEPSVRTIFRSSMTEAQHQTLNQFLNKSTESSMAPSRVHMNYVHTREVDTFYELSQSGRLALPEAIRRQMDPRNPRTIPKVRVTHTKKTGEELAKIIKVRVADLDVFSPRTRFDWRISVNVEMNIEGSIKELVEPGGVGKKGADRSKDRMTYRHQAFQIDLTQVTGTDAATNATTKEHELEIEVASQEIRRHGLLAASRQPNGYGEMVKSFADNVRILVRHC